MRAVDWRFLGRQGLLVVLAILTLVAAGGFGALIDFSLQALLTGVVLLTLGGWLLWRLRRGETLAVSGAEWAWLLFLATQLMAACLSDDVRRSLPHVVTWLGYFAVFVFVGDLLRRGWPARYVETALFVALGLVLLSGWRDWAQLWQGWRALAGLPYGPGFAQRISSLLGDPNLLAAFINLLLPLLIARGLLGGGLARGLAALLGLAALGLLYLTDSRGALLGLGTALAVFGVLWVWRVSEPAQRLASQAWGWLWARKAVLLGLGLLAGLAVGAVAWRFLSFEGDTTHGPVLTSRDLYWQAARNALASDPLTGAGPGIYPTYLMQVWSMPPGRPYFHAHSLYFHTLAESGWLGLLGLLGLVLGAGRQAAAAWRDQPEAGRARWAAACAGLAGLLVHSLVDDFFAFGAVGLAAVVLLALALQGNRSSAARSWHPLLLLVPGLLAAGFSLYALRGHSFAVQAWQAAQQGDWPAAAAQMQAAVAADPGLGAYWLHTGYAQAQIGDFTAASQSYSRGIALEPVHGLNHANLAAVYAADGQLEAALAQMRIATQQSPEAWQFWLAQGWYEEQLGQPQAVGSYGQALYFNDALVESVFWTASPVRQQALAGFSAAAPGNIHTPARDAAAEGRAQLAAGDLAAAAEALAAAHALNDQEVLVYVGFAELALAQGDLALAETYVQAALWVQTTRNQSKVEAILVGAEVAAAHGQADLAVQRYEIAYQAITSYDTYGWGSSNWSPYFWFAFQRRAFPQELLPWLPRADISPAVAQRLLPLAGLYEATGQIEAAAAVRQTLAPFLP